MADTIKYYKTGDQICATLQFTYGGSDAEANVDVSIGIPTGGTLVSATPSHGSVVGTTWTIPMIVPGIPYHVIVCVTIDVGDCTTSIFPLEFSLDSDCDCAPEVCEQVPGVSCCEFTPCVEAIFDSCDFDFSAGGTISSSYKDLEVCAPIKNNIYY